MAVVPMKKVLICGLKKDRKGTLELLQRQGVLEISNVLQEDDMLGRMDVTSSKTVFERNANIAEQAINILDRYAPEEKGMLSSFEGREVLSLDEYEANAGKHDEVMKKAYRLQASTVPRFRSWNSKWKHWCHGGPLTCPLILREQRKLRHSSVPSRMRLPWNR